MDTCTRNNIHTHTQRERDSIHPLNIFSSNKKRDYRSKFDIEMKVLPPCWVGKTDRDVRRSERHIQREPERETDKHI